MFGYVWLHGHVFLSHVAIRVSCPFFAFWLVCFWVVALPKSAQVSRVGPKSGPSQPKSGPSQAQVSPSQPKYKTQHLTITKFCHCLGQARDTESPAKAVGETTFPKPSAWPLRKDDTHKSRSLFSHDAETARDYISRGCPGPFGPGPYQVGTQSHGCHCHSSGSHLCSSETKLGWEFSG